MVKIIYYADPTKDAEIFECESVIDFLLPRFTTRDELLDLKFYDTDLLSHEIDQSNGEFLDINEGVVAITHDSMIPRAETLIYYVIVAVVVAAAVILLMPDMPVPAAARDQESGTNRLGDSSNEARVNQRIDDIFGTVNKHVPPLWQVPYKIGVNNQETEILLLGVGRGRYQIDPNKWYDGDTPVVNIPNASVSVYEPYKNPNVDTPDLVIGELIDEKIGIYRQSNDLNPAELQPPNTLENAGLEWQLTGSGANGIMTAGFIPEGFEFTEYYKVGESIKLNEFYYMKSTGSILLYNKYDTTMSTGFSTFEPPVDLGEDGTLEYEILTVTSDTLTLKIPTSATAAVVTAWSEMSSYRAQEFSARLIALGVIPPDTYIISPVIKTFDYVVSDGEIWVDVDTDNVKTLNPLAGVFFDNITGPVFAPEKATEAILNFTSPNGFYKLVDNSEVAVYASIIVKVYEVDAAGVETGNMTPFYTVHMSNGDAVTKSVFKTMRFTLPYARNKLTAERTTNRDKRDNVSNVDNVEWRDFYSFEPVNVTDFGDVTVAHVVTPSNSQSRLIKQRKQNVDLTRLITQYNSDGTLGVPESYATDQFDQILIHTALDPYIGRLTLDDINANGFLDVRDEIISYFGSDIMTKFGYNFDTTEMTFQDTFMMIADAVMCTAYAQAGVYDIFFEKKQTVSSMQITCRNKIQGSESRKTNYDRKHDGVELSYRDNDSAVSETIYIPNDQSSRNPERKELKGCTTALQATRYGSRMYNRQKYQIEYTTFDVDEFGRNITPNKRIDSPDSTRFTRREGVTDGYRVYDGEVVEVNGLQVELSEPVYFTPGEDHYITFTTSTGDNSETILCTQVDEYTILLTTMPSEPIYDGYDKDRTKYILVSEQLQQSVALIPKTIEFNLSDEGVETHTINSVNYTDKYYQNDLDILE